MNKVTMLAIALSTVALAGCFGSKTEETRQVPAASSSVEAMMSSSSVEAMSSVSSVEALTGDAMSSVEATSSSSVDAMVSSASSQS